jgi:uncharacterized protein
MGANADVVKAAWEALGQQDVDRATADIDESAEIVLQDSLPWGGTHRGPDGFKRMVSEFTSHLEEFRPSPRGFFEAEQEQVVVPVDIQARTKAGKEMAQRVLWLYELQDGKIIRAELFADTADTLEAIR